MNENYLIYNLDFQRGHLQHSTSILSALEEAQLEIEEINESMDFI